MKTRSHPGPLLTSRLPPSRFTWKPLVLAACVFLASCGGDGDNGDEGSTPAPASVERELDPTTVNSGAVTSNAKDFHVVVNPSPDVEPAHKLMVFLPGTDGVPDMYRDILRTGAGRGFHNIGLDYPNPEAVGKLCEPINLPASERTAAGVDACYLNVRSEIITGQNATSLVDVNEVNSIRTRLADALAYLGEKYPDEGWGEYIDGGNVDWSKVVVGGHSQGGGHAGLMAKLFPVSRACYFSSPPDWNAISNRPVSWEEVRSSDMTSPSKQFGFSNVDDPLVPYDQVSMIWETMGLSKSASAGVSVDSSTSYESSDAQALTTDAKPEDASAAGEPLHGMTVRDVYTPLNSKGNPLFAPVWSYMCFNK